MRALLSAQTLSVMHGLGSAGRAVWSEEGDQMALVVFARPELQSTTTSLPVGSEPGEIGAAHLPSGNSNTSACLLSLD